MLATLAKYIHSKKQWARRVLRAKLCSSKRSGEITTIWPGKQRFNGLRLKPKIQQRHTLAGRGKQRAFFGIAQRTDAQRIAQHHHLAQRIEEHQVVCAIKLSRDVLEHIDQIWLAISGKFVADGVHDDFGIVLASQMVIAIGQELRLQLFVICELAVEAEAEPLVLLQMMPLQRLGVIAVFLATRGITHMADGRPTGELLHQAFVFATVAHAKHFADATQIFVRI